MNMKIRYADVVRFLNAVPEILNAKIPSRMWMSIDLTARSLNDAGESYMKKREDILKEDTSEEEKNAAINELLQMEIEVTVQKIPQSVLDALDASDKFDALTGTQLGALHFMF